MDALLNLSKSFEQNRLLRQESLIMSAARSVAEQEGGADAFGKNLVEFANKLKDSKPHLYIQTRKLIIELFKLHDETNQATVDLAGVESEDLKAVLKGLAVEMLADDPDFRDQVLNISEPLLIEPYDD